MNICVFTYDYPSKGRFVYTFVKQIVDEFARKGNSCCVISPYPFIHHKGFCKQIEKYYVENGGYVLVIRPNYLTLSNFKIGHFCLSNYLFNRALKTALNSVPFVPDVVYAHFWNQGILALDYAKSNNCPLFVATGESDIKVVLPKKLDLIRIKKEITGVICVSTKNKKESIELGLTSEDKCVIIPNGINENLFRKMDKLSVRASLGLPKEGYIIIYVGWFNERKGIKRVVKALNEINGEPVYSILIGGEEEIECKNMLIKGRFPHETIPLYLNAADVFVLPTLKEGCCNAVVEAMACGLPIISSNLDFNLDVLNETNSILIDPNNIGEIRNSIIELRDNKVKRAYLSEGALSTAKKLTLEQRANRILSFINNNKF